MPKLSPVCLCALLVCILSSCSHSGGYRDAARFEVIAGDVRSNGLIQTVDKNISNLASVHELNDVGSAEAALQAPSCGIDDKLCRVKNIAIRWKEQYQHTDPLAFCSDMRLQVDPILCLGRACKAAKNDF